MSATVSLNPAVSRFFSESVGTVLRQNQGDKKNPPTSGENTTQAPENKNSSSKKFEGLAQPHSPKLDYQFLPESQELVVQVVNKETGEVIRQVPQEEVLHISHKISDFNPGSFEEFA